MVTLKEYFNLVKREEELGDLVITADATKGESFNEIYRTWKRGYKAKNYKTILINLKKK